MLDDIEFLVAGVSVGTRRLLSGQQPERVPRIRIVREVRADFEVAVGLREACLGGDQTRLPAARIAGRGSVRHGGDRERAVLDAERVVAGGGVDEGGFTK